MSKFRNFIAMLEKKKQFKLPVSLIDTEVHKDYEKLVKEGFLKQPVRVTTDSIEYLVYNRTKKAEAYFKQSKKKGSVINE